MLCEHRKFVHWGRQPQSDGETTFRGRITEHRLAVSNVAPRGGQGHGKPRSNRRSFPEPASASMAGVTGLSLSSVPNPGPNNRVHRTNLTAAGSISCPGSFRTIIICARTAASADPLALPSYKPNSLGTTTEQIETLRAMWVCNSDYADQVTRVIDAPGSE